MRFYRLGLYVIFFLSGVAGLGYELVWTRMFAAGLGHETASMLAVVAAFFGGFALGAWVLDRRISRSSRPGRWYAGLEVCIGAWALVLLLLIPWANDRVAMLTGPTPGALRLWSVAFVVPLLCLLPATAAMGATLPAMDRLACRLRRDGRLVGGLYGVNTLGAVAGVMLVTFVLIPAAGTNASVAALAGLNLVCAASVSLALARGERGRSPVDAPMRDAPSPPRLAVSVLVTGLLGIGYEVLGVRVLSQVLEGTVYTFAVVLSVYLCGTALGAAAYQAFGARCRPRLLLAQLLAATTVSCLLGILALPHTRAVYEAVRAARGAQLAGSVAAEVVVAAIVFLLPSFCMGATFSHLAQAARHTRGGVGRTLALNTLGGAIAPLLFGVIALPALGSKRALTCIAVGYLVLLPELRRKRLAGAAVVVLALLWLLPADLILIEPPHGGTRVDVREGVLGTVAVVADEEGNRYLKVDDRFQMGASNAVFGERRQAHVPLLLHPNPRRALFLGIGTGITASAAAAHPALSFDCVELIPEVVEVLHLFRSVNGDLATRHAARIYVADARRYVRAAQTQYDVVIADLFHPGRDGAGALYTHEHFRAIRARLAPGGLFAQWLPLFQLDVEMVRVITRTFLAVFPHSRAFLDRYSVVSPALALVGSTVPRTYTPDWFEQRVRDPRLRSALADIELTDTMTLFGVLAAGPEDLTRFAGDGPLNTDATPLIRYAAPRLAYADPGRSDETLDALLETFRPKPADVLGPVATAADRRFRVKLWAHLAARNRYLRAEMQSLAGREEQAVVLYLSSVMRSHEFWPAYDMLLQMANEKAPTDSAMASEILLSLYAAAPSRPEAGRLFRQLTGRRMPALPARTGQR